MKINNFFWKITIVIISILSSNAYCGDPDLNCSVTNFSTGFLWEQVLVPSSIGSMVLMSVCNLEATSLEILQKTITIESKLENINTGLSQSILDITETILDTSETINENLNVLQSQADAIVMSEMTLVDKTTTLNNSTISAETKIEKLASTTDQILEETCDSLSLIEDINATILINNSLIDQLLTCSTHSIRSSQTITEPGNYCVAQSFVGTVTIAISNVFLDLNGHRISNPGGTTIAINSGLNLITITNGALGAAATGISIGNGVTNLDIVNVDILDCTSSGINGVGTTANPISRLRLTDCLVRNASSGIGIQFNNLTNSQINSCEIALSTTGAQLTNCSDMQIDSSTANHNLVAGFSLITSSTNTFSNCEALGNGFASTDGSYGFISNNGLGNIFQNCIADGTTTTTTNFNSIVAGFALTGSEMCSKIVGCEGCNTTGPSATSIVNTATITASGIPYGIVLQGTLTQLTQLTSVNEGGQVASVNWSPDGKYLATAGDVVGSPASTTRIYQFNPSQGTLNLIARANHGSTLLSVNWSPDGKYVATGGLLGSGATTRVYQFDQTTNSLTLITSIDNGTVTSVNWSPNGKYLATGHTFSPSGTIRVYQFDPLTKTLNLVANVNHGATVSSVNWSPDGNYLAIGGSVSSGATTRVYQFNATAGSLSLIVSVNDVSTINSVNWSPDGNYLATGGNAAGAPTATTRSYLFNKGTGSLTLIANANDGSTVSSLNWSPDNKYLATSNSTSTNVYQFKPVTGNLSIITSASHGSTLFSVNWSPDGTHLSVGGTVSSGASTRVYNAIQFPTNNIIQNNVTYCNLVATATQITGVGISGSNIANLIIENTSYNNAFNYQFVTLPGIYNPLFNYLPSPLQNISQAGGQPVSYPQNIVGYTNIIEAQVRAVETKLDSIIEKLCTTESLLALPYQTLYQSALDIIMPFTSIVDLLEPCQQTTIFLPTTISTSGSYCLGQNINGEIIINADAVHLDLSGHTISGGTNGVTVNSNIKLATIQNGTINSVTNNGINILSGANAVQINNINIEFATQAGISVNSANSIFINKCDMSFCGTGLQVNSSNKVIVNNCSAIANNLVGFNLVSSSTNVLLDNKAIGNGTASTADSYGFASQNGSGNIFERCIASSTVTTATSNSFVAAGIALLGTEMCSKIVDCKSCDNFTQLNSSANAQVYGIYLQPSLLSQMLTVTAISAVATVNAVEWSPDNRFVAIATDSIVNVYGFSAINNTLTFLTTATHGATVNTVDWSPTGQFLAIGGDVVGTATTNIRVYQFVIVTQQLKEVSSTSYGNASVNSVSWSPNGQFLVVSGGLLTTPVNNTNLKLYEFDLFSKSLIFRDSKTWAGLASPGAALSVDWSPNGNFVVKSDQGNAGAGIVYSFNPNTKTLSTVSSSAGGSPIAVSWSPLGNYIAIGQATFGGSLQILGVDPNTGVFSGSSNPIVLVQVSSISWSPDGRYVAIVNSTSNNILVYRLDISTNTSGTGQRSLTQVFNQSTSGNLSSVHWSPDGQWLLVGGSTGSDGNAVRIFQVQSFPTRNIVKGNTVSCNIGSSRVNFSASVQNTPLGFGIGGSSVANLIINNLAYNNTINFTNVTNLYTELLYGDAAPSPLQNISLIGNQPLQKQENINLLVDNIQTIATAMQTKVDFLYRAAFP